MAVEALAVLFQCGNVGGHLVADVAGHRLVGTMLRLNVQTSVGYPGGGESI